MSEQDTNTPPMSWDELPLVLTTEEASALLRVHINTIKKMCNEGRLPANKVGRDWRIDRDELHAFLRGSFHSADEE